jgi:hypothetical protein
LGPVLLTHDPAIDASSTAEIMTDDVYNAASAQVYDGPRSG